jgi:hypothetical protein
VCVHFAKKQLTWPGLRFQSLFTYFMTHVDTKPPLLSATFPKLSRELQQLLASAGEFALAAQVPELEILDRCRCGDDFCATFYTQPKPVGPYGPGLRNIALQPKEGMLILDVVDGVIAQVELLYRDEVRHKLLTVFP